MTILGMPTSMFLVFAATVLAGSLGAIHYVIVHVILDRPFADEEKAIGTRDPAEPTTSPGRAARVEREARRAGSSGHSPTEGAGGGEGRGASSEGTDGHD